MKTLDSIKHLQVDEVQLIYKSKIPPSERLKVSCSKDAYEAFLNAWDDDTLEHHEEFKVMLLNRANKVLGIITISRGGLSGTVVDLKQIFQAALKSNSSSIIVGHNHPSGNKQPSEADSRITKKIRDAGKFLDISVVDHLILIPGQDFYSYADEGML